MSSLLFGFAVFFCFFLHGALWVEPLFTWARHPGLLYWRMLSRFWRMICFLGNSLDYNDTPHSWRCLAKCFEIHGKRISLGSTSTIAWNVLFFTIHAWNRSRCGNVYVPLGSMKDFWRKQLASDDKGIVVWRRGREYQRKEIWGMCRMMNKLAYSPWFDYSRTWQWMNETCNLWLRALGKCSATWRYKVCS